MSERMMTRRGFAGWVGKILAATALGGAFAAEGQVFRERNQPQLRGEYIGVSKRADFNEALNDAVRQAILRRDIRHRMLQWRVTEMSGSVGGRAGRGEMVVKIRAELV